MFLLWVTFQLSILYETFFRDKPYDISTIGAQPLKVLLQVSQL